MKFKLDENLPVSSSAILTSSGHDVDTVKAASDLATLTNPDSLAGAVAVLQRGLLRIRHP